MKVGNVQEYTNHAYGHTTSQDYIYDGLYQLKEAKGVSNSHPYGASGSAEYTTDYTQKFSFNQIGNMTSKTSEEFVSNTNRIGANLNYNLDYVYYAGTHKAERIGDRYYDYDRNGNLIAEREGGHAVTPEVYRPYYRDGDMYYTDYGFGLVKPNSAPPDDGSYQRNYRWNERNLLSESSDSIYTVQYRYGADGQRALKFTANNGKNTAYFNKMWQTSDPTTGDWLQSKHIYVNEDRITTKYNNENNNNTAAEKEKTYYYHSDHLGSAQTVTNYRGQVHERLEYTPYGELWIDWRNADAPEDSTPFRFTGKELDAETGLYYYGARYLDPKTSRWLSGDPALGEYFPSAPVNDEAKKRNQNLPGQGGVFNYVNLHAYHYAGNNPVKYVDPDGKSPESALKLIIKHRERIKYVASMYGVDPVGIASVIFQEKFHGIAADVKDLIPLIIDRGVNDNTPSQRSYGLAEMQLRLAAELFGEDLNEPGTQKKMYDMLKNDDWSITFIGINIKKNETELKIKLKGAAAGGAHNMGSTGYKAFLDGKRKLSPVAERSVDYQKAINDALNGTLNSKKDSERTD
jgi:RHS repeat-associated protein